MGGSSDAAMSEGILNSAAIATESTFKGSAGAFTRIPGKLKFYAEPIHHWGEQRAGFNRGRTKDSHVGLHWRGFIEAEASLLAPVVTILGSILGTKQTQADTPAAGLTTYTLVPSWHYTRGSRRLALDYNPSGPYYTYRGVIFTAMRLSMELNRLANFRADFIAAKRVTEVSATGGSALTHAALSHMNASVELNNAAWNDVTELNWTLSHSVEPAGFGADKEARTFKTTGRFEMTAEIAGYFTDAAIADRHASQAETALEMTLASGQKTIALNWPRAVFKGGTPEGLGKGDLVYRAVMEGLHDAAEAAGNPTLTVTV